MSMACMTQAAAAPLAVPAASTGFDLTIVDPDVSGAKGSARVTVSADLWVTTLHRWQFQRE